jgi:hypothetical protein
MQPIQHRFDHGLVEFLQGIGVRYAMHHVVVDSIEDLGAITMGRRMIWDNLLHIITMGRRMIWDNLLHIKLVLDETREIKDNREREIV